jgi:hypothetical protein
MIKLQNLKVDRMAVAADAATNTVADVGLEEPETDTTDYKMMPDK